MMKTEIRLTGPEAKRINERANFHARFHETGVGLVIIEPSNTPMVYHIVSALNASQNYPEAQVVIIQSDPHTPNIVNKATAVSYTHLTLPTKLEV